MVALFIRQLADCVETIFSQNMFLPYHHAPPFWPTS